MRYATLITENLPSHPSARDPEYRAVLKSITKSLPDVFERLEALKPRIEARYAQWLKAQERREASIVVNREQSRSQLRTHFSASDPAVAGNSTTLAAAEHEDLAVKVAHKEIRRRDAARKATRQAGVSEEEEQERRTAGLWDDWEAALSRDNQSVEDSDMRNQMEATRRRLDGAHDIVSDGVRRDLSKRQPIRVPPSIQNGNEYRYPSISKPQPLRYDEMSVNRRDSTPHNNLLPSKPPKERYTNDSPLSVESAPPVPEKVISEPPASEIPDESRSKPGYTFRPAAYLENGNPLRTVFINPTLRKTFLDYAAPNTRANLETCGMLCGTLISNALFVSKLVIPDQESTSDTCETVNEGALFDYCASEDLMVLGWIHTHPTQTCFMSSRDLHTHCGYQVMMPESIAIVCAPTKNPKYVSYPFVPQVGWLCC